MCAAADATVAAFIVYQPKNVVNELVAEAVVLVEPGAFGVVCNVVLDEHKPAGLVRVEAPAAFLNGAERRREGE